MTPFNRRIRTSGSFFHKKLVSGNYRLEYGQISDEERQRMIDSNAALLRQTDDQLSGLNYLKNRIDGKLPGLEKVQDETQRLAQIHRSQRALDLIDHIDDIKPEKWATLDTDQRKAALVKVHEAYAKAFGMDPVKLEFGKVPQSGSGTMMLGLFRWDTNTIYIDDRVMSPASNPRLVWSLVDTAVHESRHALQHQAEEHPEKFPYISDVQIKVWQENDNNYIPANENHERYQNQPVESDARKAGHEAHDYVYPRPRGQTSDQPGQSGPVQPHGPMLSPAGPPKPKKK